MIGHTEGITHIDSKGDGRYFISNCKDQTVKLWDIRRMSDASAAAAKIRERPLPVWNWDYRYMRFPGTGWDMKHPDDASLQTYSGHLVDQTLIRAYFSPAATTGQRYIYSGSSDGVVAFWDVVSGKRVGDDERFGCDEDEDVGGGGGGGDSKRRRRNRRGPRGDDDDRGEEEEEEEEEDDDDDDGNGHEGGGGGGRQSARGRRGYARGGLAGRATATTATAAAAGSGSPRRRPTASAAQNIPGRGSGRGPVVRDVSWHPTQPMLVSVAWDGSVVRWDAGG